MIKILSTFILLFLGQSAFPSQFDLSGFSENTEFILLSTEEAEGIIADSEIIFLTGFLKELHKKRISFKTNSQFYFGTSQPKKNTSGETHRVIPNLSKARIIYPFHSFP